MTEYRRLEHGEVVQAGDEYDSSRDPWRDPVRWEPVYESQIGRLAPDPRYPAHTIYRRPVEE